MARSLSKLLIDIRPQAEIFAGAASASLIRQLSEKMCVDQLDLKHKVIWRVKTEDAILAKFRSPRLSNSRVPIINDLVGIRVLGETLEQIDGLKREISSWASQFNLTGLDVEDRFNLPDPSGYRAIHFNYISETAEHNIPPEAGIELQLTTWLQHLHSILAHRLYYKTQIPPSPSTVKLLNDLSTKLHSFDSEITLLLDREI